MTTIKATCPECGDVDLEPKNVKIHSYMGGLSVYRFLCPSEHHKGIVTKPADEEIEQLLLSAKVEKIVIKRPAEIDDTDRITIPQRLGGLTTGEIYDTRLDLALHANKFISSSK